MNYLKQTSHDVGAPEEVNHNNESKRIYSINPNKFKEINSLELEKKEASPENNYFKVDDHGAWYIENNKSLRICSKLEVKALVRDNESENWGRLLEFPDADGRIHSWAMPMEMLKGSGEELRGELLRRGLEISPGMRMRNLLVEYIIQSKTDQRVRCVTRTGWYHQMFVFPNQTIGKTSESILYQSENRSQDYQSSGPLEEWQQHIAKRCEGNSRLVFSVSMAFASFLLKPAQMESGGIHFVGHSSSGKTTVLRLAASVFGPPNYMNRWRATTNGLEALAALRSDMLLILDELAQVDPKDAGEIAYMLANGSGKTRANKSGNARPCQEWRMLFLSAGEVSLSQHMYEAGKKARAGQEVRLVDIPADAGCGLGIFENLHSLSTASEFSQILQTATTHHYGVAAIAFLEKITQDNIWNELATKIQKFRQEFIKDNLPNQASSQVYRVCERFALIALAGELSTALGITGWLEGVAAQASQSCFKSWLDYRGGINDQEKITVLSQIRNFFETHGESRFTEWNSLSPRTINRAGFKKTETEGITFYILPESFRREICSGLDYHTATQILIQEKWLQPGEDGKPYRRETLPQLGRSRCYVFTQKIWEDE